MWGQEINEKKSHLIGWKHFCVSKSLGGLGFKEIKLELVNDNRLRCQVLKGKYGKGNNWLKELKTSSFDSKLRRDIGKV